MAHQDDYQRAVLFHSVLRWTLRVVVVLTVLSFVGWAAMQAFTDSTGSIFLAKGIVMLPFAASLVVALRVINFWRALAHPDCCEGSGSSRPAN